MSSSTIYWNADRIMKLIITLSLTVAIVLLINYLSNVLLPFFVACFIAYLLQPLVELNRRWTHEKGRVISSLLALLEVSLVIGGVIYIFMPHVVDELNSLGKILHDLNSGKRQIPPEFDGIVMFVQTHFNPENIRENIEAMHFQTLINKGSSLLNESFNVILQTLSWLMTLIYVIFILIDYPQMSRGFKMIVPYKYREGAMSVVHDVQVNMNHYFRGQGFLALCAMILYSIGFSIIGLPLAIPMGLLVGVLYMIPYVQYVTIIPVAVICLIYSLGGAESFGAIFGKSMLVYLIVQPTCDYIITPHVMGKEMGLNAAIILLALSVWGSLLGIIGMIVALPLTSLIMSYYERYISNPQNKN